MWEFNGDKQEGEKYNACLLVTSRPRHAVVAVCKSFKRARFSFFVVKKWLKTSNNLKEC
jgi:hypothetical protein